MFTERRLLPCVSYYGVAKIHGQGNAFDNHPWIGNRHRQSTRSAPTPTLRSCETITNSIVDVDVDEQPSPRTGVVDSLDHGARIGTAEERRSRGESSHIEVGLLPAEIQWKGQNRDRGDLFTASYPCPYPCPPLPLHSILAPPTRGKGGDQRTVHRETPDVTSGILTEMQRRGP